MKRHLLERGATVAAAVMLVYGGVLAQSVSTPSPSPGPPTISPGMPATSPGLPTTATPGLPTSGVPASATQATPPPPNPAYGGASYLPAPASPMTAATAQAMPDARTLSRSDDPATAFHALDPLNRGYVTRADTDKISGFMGFDNADIDRDGRLTPEEFQNAWRYFAQ
jgi:hypothetical protein